MPNALFYSLSTVCHYFTLYRLFIQCHYAQCSLLKSAQILQLHYDVPSFGSVSISPLLSSKLCPMSTSIFNVQSVVCISLCLLSYSKICDLSVFHKTAFWFCVTLSLMSSTFCPISVSTRTSHCTVCWFCVTVSTAVLYILSSLCLYFTLNCLLVLCHCVHCCLLLSLHCLSVLCNIRLLVLCHYIHCSLLNSALRLSVLHTVPSVLSASLFH